MQADFEAAQIVEAGVDWVTLTCNSPDLTERFQALGQSLLHVEHEAGFKCQPWRMSGFEGFHAGGVALGIRDELSLMRLSSVMAWSYWREAFKFSTNCSRLDLQVTVGPVTDPQGMVLYSHEQATRHIESWLRKPEIGLRLSNRSSPTLYLNQRTSARFGRVYDKGDESGLDHYKGCVRFEVQYNDDAALSMSRTIHAKTLKPTEVVPQVSYFFTSRGISFPFFATACRGVDPPRRTTNDERRLLWLRTQVRPAVRDLRDRGLLLEVLQALGLHVETSSNSINPSWTITEGAKPK